MHDFQVTNLHSVVLLTPLSPQANEWSDKHLPQAMHFNGATLAIEPRYMPAILEGIAEEGLTV